jgi:hypothetical protein
MKNKHILWDHNLLGIFPKGDRKLLYKQFLNSHDDIGPNIMIVKATQNIQQ